MSQIVITVVVNVTGALAAGTPDHHIVMIDNNKAAGSLHEATDHLHTAVREGDTLVWVVTSLECETYAAITALSLPEDVCEVRCETYPDTAVTYWVGTVKKAVTAPVPYGLTFALGSSLYTLPTSPNCALIEAQSIVVPEAAA